MKGLFSIQYSVFNYVWVLGWVFQGPVCVCVSLGVGKLEQMHLNSCQISLAYASVIFLSLA